jgi:hypothetical protein
MESGSDLSARAQAGEVGKAKQPRKRGLQPTDWVQDEKDGEPVWDQTTIDRLWVTTQREAMIESGPPPAANAPATQEKSSSSGQKAAKPVKKN